MNFNFIKQTFTNFKMTGAIMPLQKSTANKIVEDIDFSRVHQVVEFGAGTGALTDAILNEMTNKNAMLFLIESNPEFAEFLTAKYKTTHNVIVFNDYAQLWNYVVEDETVDIVFNSIPMSLLEKDVRMHIYYRAKDLLKNNGLFVQYQYRKSCMYDIFACFKQNVDIVFTMTNIIPTHIFKTRKSSL